MIHKCSRTSAATSTGIKSADYSEWIVIKIHLRCSKN